MHCRRPFRPLPNYKAKAGFKAVALGKVKAKARFELITLLRNNFADIPVTKDSGFYNRLVQYTQAKLQRSAKSVLLCIVIAN
ncbi:hypothetical protein GGTG_02577 [Gaeumannomyces tritici R3-111a-1]|uniref:Uncharacterized protein n=1 Tax=Gaeumannomyces tritici (strain R3-111a-1) TaxID=644352 RepID=J3NMS1_GAET3|nr:hypothetical protein GGTG_02577 [Gaeumannomyces tritici R3-111a-1]EJT82604.1 hypothetical protein GGTG_02577 [Gaeumannomyces tritici R3-111a-1]